VSLANSNYFREDADLTFDLRLPTLERVYRPWSWLHLGQGAKLKHVVEGEAAYEYVTGANEFDRIIHFDDTDIVSNTNQLTLSLVNRLYRKDKNGNVNEFATWKLAQARYFDPTFGGAAVSGQRTITAATEELTPYAFVDGPRNYSPVVSTLTLYPYPSFTVEWRAEYDPLRSKMIVNSYSTGYRHKQYFASVGETSITTNPLLFPQSNQISIGGGWGSANRKGWNVGATDLYDVLLQRNVFQFVQGSYNTDCCGFSLQYRRINFGIRNENQYLFSFSLANLGTFGSLQKQERIF
jgi:LPS-assembly protein